MTTTELAQLSQLPASTLSQRAYDAIINRDPDAALITALAAEAHREKS